MNAPGTNLQPSRLDRFVSGYQGGLLLFILPFLLYGMSLSYPLLFLDDGIYYLSNPLTQDGKLGGLLTVWTGRHFGWSPITHLSIWIDLWFQTKGVDGWWLARLHNMAWFGVGVLGVRKVIQQLTGCPRTAWTIALLYAIHPLCSSTVMWLALRRQTLCLACVFWSVAWYLDSFGRTRPQQILYLSVAATLCAAACMSRFLGVIAWPLCFLLPTLMHGQSPWLHWKRSLAILVPAIAVTSVNLLWTDPSAVSYHRLGDSLPASFLLQGEILARYLYHAVWPWDLATYYTIDETVRAVRVLWWAVPIAVCWALVLLNPSRTRGCILVLAIVSIILPISNVMSQVFPMADHYVAPALPFLFLAAYESLSRLKGLGSWLHMRLPHWRFILPGSLALFLLLAAWPRHWQYASDFTFVRHAIRHSPHTAFWWSQLAALSSQKSDQDSLEIVQLASKKALGCFDVYRLNDNNLYIVILSQIIAETSAHRPEAAHALITQFNGILDPKIIIFLRAITHAQMDERQLALRFLRLICPLSQGAIQQRAQPYIDQRTFPEIHLDPRSRSMFGDLDTLGSKGNTALWGQRILYILAETLQKEGNQGEATFVCLALLDQNPQMIYAWQTLVRALNAMHETDLANEAQSRADKVEAWLCPADG